MDAVNLVSLVKGRPGDKAGGPATKQWQGLFVKSVDQGKRQITALASTSDPDRDGDIILPTAFKKWLPTYLRNPVILAEHSHRLGDGKSPVVGKCVSAQIDKAGLHIVVEFAETEAAEDHWQLYKGKFQRAFSVGFIPHASEDRKIDGNVVRVFTEVELLEISCVPVPSNREALSKSAKRKRDFVAAKQAATGKEWLAAIRGVDAWVKRLELWDNTPKEKRAAVFSADEVAEFSKLDADGAELAKMYMAADDVGDSLGERANGPKKLRALARHMFDVVGGDAATRMINALKGDDVETNTGVSLDELVRRR